ncbi:MAG: hypothetical protein Q9191_000607 [Dirinaria sp. TL-2023a]
MSSVQAVPFAFNFVQYLTCSVPLLLPGKNSEIRFQVMSCFSFKSTRSASSSSDEWEAEKGLARYSYSLLGLENMPCRWEDE